MLKHNVPTTPGRATDTAEGAKAIAEEIGKPVMVKAQVKAGGRGKAGGVKYAATADDAFTHAQNILGLDIKGDIVKELLVAEASDIAEEYYISSPCSTVRIAPIWRCARSKAAWRSKR